MAEMEEKRDDLQSAIDHLHFKLNHFYDHVQSSEEELRELERQHKDKNESNKN
ncbi:hypothetical protein [Pediococcus ethanolidurans]|nr:hypothetical protein [Pediococcus ethanolidurans]